MSHLVTFFGLPFHSILRDLKLGLFGSVSIDIYFLCTKVSEMHHSFCFKAETRDKGGGGLRTAVAPALLLVRKSHSK